MKRIVTLFLILRFLLLPITSSANDETASASGSATDDYIPEDGEDYLSFLELGSMNGVLVHCLNRRLDGVSERIDIPTGFPIGTSVHNVAYVGTNGIISFERGFYYWYPYPFPTPWWSVQSRYVVAPFWSDNDIRLKGEVCYEVHNRHDELMDSVSEYISTTIGTKFRGRWMLLAQWDGVHPYPHGSSNYNWWWWWYSQKLKEFANNVNTYQGIVITDGATSYSLFTYKCDMIQWSGYWRHATIGYNAAGEFYKNHPLTGLSQVMSIGCLNNPEFEWNNVVYQLSVSADYIQQKKVRCYDMIDEDEINHGDYQKITNIANKLEPCPCSWWQGWRDRRFRFDWGAWYHGSLCYHQRFPSIDDASQYCCYSRNSPGWGSIKRSHEPGKYGTNMLRYHPRYYDNYQVHDRDIRETCCTVGLCDIFYNRRPQQNCNGYRPPPWTWGWGDPHITTLDNVRYTFNGLGEYRMLELKDGSFKIQGRTGRVGGDGNATEFVALAFSLTEDNETIEVQNVNNSFVVYHNGTDISDELSEVNDTYTNDAETVEVIRASEKSTETIFVNGISITTNISVGILHYTIALPEEFKGQTSGLVGNFNDNTTDDLMSVDGTLYDPQNETEIYEFGESWKVSNESESLFESPNPDPDPSFFPAFVSDLIGNASAEIREACGNDEQCIYDALQTGNVEVGLTTLQIQQNTTNEVEQLMNFPPIMEGDNILEVFPDVITTYMFNVTDSDNFTVIVSGNDNGELSYLNGSTWVYSFTWTRGDTLNFTVSFVAVDSFNASTILDPQVRICGCINDGNCTEVGVTDVSADPVVLQCDCIEEVWTGQFCEEDLDGCEEFGCFPGATCSDNPAPESGATCDCPQGFNQIGEMCDDIDECENTPINDCEQVCINTEGSYYCECLTGFKFIAGSTTHCEDINECEVYNDCHRICNNTIGSYRCSCIEGFTLTSDNATCKAKTPCPNEPSIPLLCALLQDGTESYACIKGYLIQELETNNQICTDINECELGVCDQNCNNTDGSFTCSCEEGYTMNTDNRSCDDINECVEYALNDTLLCHEDEICENIPGSYQCICPLGAHKVEDGCIADIFMMEQYTTSSLLLLSSTPVTTNTPSTPPSIPPKDDTGLSREIIISISAGSALGLLIALALIVIISYILKRYHKRSKKTKIHPETEEDDDDDDSLYVWKTQRKGGRSIRLVSVTSQDIPKLW